MRDRLIIGDNRAVLDSGLLAPCLGKVKMIYIDPPYNTRTGKSYNDSLDSGVWLERIAAVVARLAAYLAEDGVIFISIDDNEYANLKICCDSVFGRGNFIGTFITRQAQRSNSRLINVVHEYVCCYARDKSRLARFAIRRVNIPEQRDMINELRAQIKALQGLGIKEAEKRLKRLIAACCAKYGITWLKNYSCVDDDGEIYFPCDLSVPGEPREVRIPAINLRLAPLKSRGWASDQRFIELHGKNLLAFRNGRPYRKKFLKDAEDNAPSILNFYSRFGTKDLEKLGLKDVFDTPKPVELIKFLIRMANVKNGLVLDCYAGSGATGQAVLEVNKEDGADARFILIQQKEALAKNSRAARACQRLGIAPIVSEVAKIRLERARGKLGLANNLEVIDWA